MHVEAADIVSGIVIGAGATLIMDAWNLFLKRAFGIPSLDYCMLGRWVRHMPAVFFHANIAAAPAKSKECTAGWLAHYSIGMTMALAFVVLAPRDWLARPTLMPAVLFGAGTVVLPFLLLQPALGLGIASANAARPMQARLKSMATHVVYGTGLYIWALVLS